MIFPPKLKSGDTVGIVAPARKISPKEVEPAIIVLESWGLSTRLGENIFSPNHSYLAGTDRERAKDFQTMVDDPDVKAIFCARGGYGSTRIIDDIDFTPLKRNPKWIVGFSDVTAFHLKLLSNEIASIHATMPIFYGRKESQSSVESIRKLLLEGNCVITSALSEFNRLGHAVGEVIGGNLSLLVDSLNTRSEPDLENKILIVEEVDEYFYKLDRMFTQLRRSGKLKGLAGLIIGHMTDIKNSDLDFGETIHDIILHAVRDYNFPVAFSFPSGHHEPNHAWIEGGKAILDVTLINVVLRYENIYVARE